jgi:hypothetical protein
MICAHSKNKAGLLATVHHGCPTRSTARKFTPVVLILEGEVLQEKNVNDLRGLQKYHCYAIYERPSIIRDRTAKKIAYKYTHAHSCIHRSR